MNGYLISILMGALMTGFALLSPRRGRLLSGLSFVLGLVVNELPLAMLAWLLLSTGLAAIDGGIGGIQDLIAVALLAPITAGLGLVLARQLAARPALTAAFRAAGLEDAASAVATPRGRGQLVVDLLAPFAMAGRGVRRIRNVRYGPHGRKNLLDIYTSGRTERAPVVVYAHGGGYFSGRKSKEARLLLNRLARAGYLCLSINYRLRPQVGFDGHLADYAAALRWAATRAEQYGGDPRRLVLAGTSAGAHLASIAGLSPEVTAGDDSGGIESGTVRAVLGFAGYYGPYYGLDARHRPSSDPVDHVDADAPPFLIVHGELDPYVPVGLARRLAEAVRAHSRRTVASVELPGTHHVFDLFRTPRYRAVVDAAEAFLAAEVPVDSVPDASAATRSVGARR